MLHSVSGRHSCLGAQIGAKFKFMEALENQLSNTNKLPRSIQLIIYNTRVSLFIAPIL